MLLAHDRATFDKPEGWNSMKIEQSPLLSDFSVMWSKLKETYLRNYLPLHFRKSLKKIW